MITSLSTATLQLSNFLSLAILPAPLNFHVLEPYVRSFLLHSFNFKPNGALSHTCLSYMLSGSCVGGKLGNWEVPTNSLLVRRLGDICKLGQRK